MFWIGYDVISIALFSCVCLCHSHHRCLLPGENDLILYVSWNVPTSPPWKLFPPTYSPVCWYHAERVGITPWCFRFHLLFKPPYCLFAEFPILTATLLKAVFLGWRLACGRFWRACIPFDGLGNEDDAVELRQYWAKPGIIIYIGGVCVPIKAHVLLTTTKQSSTPAILPPS